MLQHSGPAHDILYLSQGSNSATIDRVIAAEHLAQVGFGIEAVELGAFNKGVDRGAARSPPALDPTHILPKQGINVRFSETDHPAHIERLIDDSTRAVFCESVGNPAGNICVIEALAGIAHKHGIPLIVDNTVATPILLRPIEYGADIVVHSLTKFMGGHGTTLGGIIVDSGNFP